MSVDGGDGPVGVEGLQRRSQLALRLRSSARRHAASAAAVERLSAELPVGRLSGRSAVRSGLQSRVRTGEAEFGGR